MIPVNMNSLLLTSETKEKGKEKRQSNLELLRIICALLIVFDHFASKGGSAYISISPNRIIADLLVPGGKLGVTVFVIVGAYFLNDADFKIERILRIWIEIFFYSVGINLVCLGGGRIGKTDVTVKSMIKGFFPCFGVPYWFGSAYIALLVISPFLIWLIKNISQNMYIYILISLGMLLCLIPTILVWGTNVYSNDFLWFCFLFMLVGFLKTRGIFEKWKMRHFVYLFLVSISIIWLSMIGILFIGKVYPSLEALASRNFDYFGGRMSGVFIPCAAFGLFGMFYNIQLPYNKWINKIAASSFGVYLIHCHPAIKEDYLWQKIFHCAEWYYAPTYIFIMKMIGTVMCIYLVCTIIDMLRIVLLEKKIFREQHLKQFCNKVDTKVKRLINY